MFDILTTGAMVDELRRTILDGRIQRIGLVDALTIAMEVYADGRRHYLVASASTRNARVHLVPNMPSTDPALITPFGLQLRKYIRGGYITDINHPPLERIMTFSIAKRMGPSTEADETEGSGEDGGESEDDIWSGENISRLDLVIEIMGRHSNLILVQEDRRIRESAKRVTSSMSRVRPILPKYPYTHPPVPDKFDPRQTTSATMQNVLATASPNEKITDVLVRSFRSVSPAIAREVVWQVCGDLGARVDDLSVDDAGELARSLRTLYQPLLTGIWSPTIYLHDGSVVEYAAVPMIHLAARYQPVSVRTISEAITRVEADTGTDTPQDHDQRRARLIQAIDQVLQGQHARLHNLQQQYERIHETDRLRRWGESILAWMWQLQPGDSELVVETEIGEEHIPLLPGLSPQETAAEYFSQYRKSQKAGVQLPERIDATRTEISWLEQLRWQAAEAQGFAALEDIRREFEEHNQPPQPSQSGKPLRPRKSAVSRVTPLSDPDGNLYYVGKNNRQNEQVTFDIASASDWWLHARNIPGSHVILRTRIPVDQPDDALVQRAASLAAWYSQGRTSGNVEVDIAQRRYVRKIHGAGPGMVTYRNERTIVAPARSESELGLE